VTDLQRLERAGFIREQPGMWLVMIYAVGFLGISVSVDLWNLFLTPPMNMAGSGRYLFTLGITLPQWIGLRSWARRVLEARPRSAEP